MFRPVISSVISCALVTLSASPALANRPGPSKHQLDFELGSGNYQCEYGVRIDVQRAPREQGAMQIGWQGKRYNLARDPSESGLPRYEDRGNGLVWIDLPWKGVLLDGRTNKPLANECKTV